MSFLYLFFIGILIGSAMVVPGVSGAVIAVIFGLYDKAIKSFSNLLTDFKKNFIFLLNIGIGVLIGAIWFGNILLFLYSKHEVITKLSFAGFILGGIPYLFKKVKEKKETINYYLLIISFLISISMSYISKNISINNTNYSFIKLFISGIIYSIGKVIPGISGSFLMIVIGMYDFILKVVAHPITYGFKNISYVLPFMIGLLIGIIILVKLMDKLLEKHFGILYSIIIGLLIGSILILLPNTININILICKVPVMILSFLLSYFLLKNA